MITESILYGYALNICRKKLEEKYETAKCRNQLEKKPDLYLDRTAALYGRLFGNYAVYTAFYPR